MPRRALIVEDEPDMVASLERLLRRRGLDVVAAGTVAGGLALVREMPLTLLVCDLRLPDGDGLEVVRAAYHARPRPPVIVMTGYSSQGSRQAALAAGAAAYVSKPFSLAALEGAISAALAGPAEADRS
jgi:two-component system response regulator RegA